MKLVAASLLLGQVLGQSYQIVNDARSQIEFLRVRRKNSGFFEEAQDDNFDRECVEEMCSFEELMEIKDNEDEAKKAWQLLTKKCYEDQCSAQGTKLCVQTWNKRTCHCKDGWHNEGEKDDCSLDDDECAGDNSCTGQNQVCVNSPGSYSCECKVGYRSDGNGNCENIDECAEEIDQCGENSTCVDLEGTFNCECHTGYSSNPETNICEDDDECAEGSDCPENSVCVNTPGSFKCQCNDGYTEVDGVCADVDECSSGDVDCGLGSCQNNDGSYTCFCTVGYINDGDPMTGPCVDENECENDSSICLASQTCHNTQGSHKCCEAGQDFAENTGECIDKDPCEGIECDENSSCQAGVCLCDAGYRRLESENSDFIPLQSVLSDELSSGEAAAPESASSSPCVPHCHNNPCGDGFVCENGEKSFSCIDKCNNGDVSCIGGTCAEGVCTCDADSVNVGGVCIATTTEKVVTPPPAAQQLDTQPEKVCAPGFSHDGVECVDTDECQINNGGCDSMCMNYYGTHRCYENMHEEEAMCHHTSVKSSSIAGYECVCFKNYHLCNDGFSCVTNNGYNKYNRRGKFDYEGATSCPSGQFGVDGNCFSVSSDKKTHSAAAEACENEGGSLVNLQSRKVWWVVGNKVEYGEASFWVDPNSDAGMYVYGDNNGALLANPAGNMDNVPPQLNAVDGNELHFFACQF